MYGVLDLPRTCYAFLSAHIKNVAPRRMRSMSYVSRSISYVCSRMYDVRVTYFSYLDTPYIRESIRGLIIIDKIAVTPSRIDSRIYGVHVQSTFCICYVCVTFEWRILDSLFVFTAYQGRTCGVSRVSMAYVLRMCYVRFATVEYV